jgi:hypothetical protein
MIHAQRALDHQDLMARGLRCRVQAFKHLFGITGFPGQRPVPLLQVIEVLGLHRIAPFPLIRTSSAINIVAMPVENFLYHIAFRNPSPSGSLKAGSAKMLKYKRGF